MTIDDLIFFSSTTGGAQFPHQHSHCWLGGVFPAGRTRLLLVAEAATSNCMQKCDRLLVHKLIDGLTWVKHGSWLNLAKHGSNPGWILVHVRPSLLCVYLWRGKAFTLSCYLLKQTPPLMSANIWEGELSIIDNTTCSRGRMHNKLHAHSISDRIKKYIKKTFNCIFIGLKEKQIKKLIEG